MLELKWIALIALILQNSGQAILMRYTFLIDNSDDRYIASTAVLNAEILKLLVALFFCYYKDSMQDWKILQNTLYLEFVEQQNDFFKLMIPSLLYTLQNSLQYFSMSCLSAPVFQVLYQMKIITTALFSVILLSRRLSNTQWISVVALAIGVSMVQLSQDKEDPAHQSNSFAGLISVLISCLTSGFAGVYFEMVLKGTNASIWLRNIQLALIGILFSLISCILKDGYAISQKGYFFGYNKYVWGVILLQALGGLLVAVVVKYADNVLKGFATSFSILLSSFISYMFFFDIQVTTTYILGALVVIASAYIFGVSYPIALPNSTTSSLNNDSSMSLTSLINNNKKEDDDHDDEEEPLILKA